ncbi:sodium:solute symporter family protein [Chlorobaculum sp. 24CR]|uniref:sodium:solute symporter family protein n=1 Tax=Chlorobaculum sp. 24CR TaxID=2508878 RepID=UPI00100B44DD|nr:sodium:solute symporter family protein [Chlorobaculum sp. 24CR]RXK85035.1 sodium:solute symporter family protein [Chlorobaculum sp. 24CR]
MDGIDYLIFGVYMTVILGVGVYHFRRNGDAEDYYVGGRDIAPSHVGLSIVATDVGGGFSIGLGGVGFLMGLAGSWLLFTGLVGAWLSAVLLIPRLKKIDREQGFMTYPDFLRYRYDRRVAVLAALISGIGYLGFTAAQMLAGAKLASATILQTNPFGMEQVSFALLIIALVTVLYTMIGGLKAVIYTDTVQWIVLLAGLMLVTIPVTLVKIGGFGALVAALPPSHFSLTSIEPATFINWMITIVPIWFVGMTLYQRVYACRDEREAKKAWYIAGIFEYPIMAFTGVFLGMCARVVFPEAEPEQAMPMLISQVLPVGVTGIVVAAYFSAIMSTADSCMMAASGNFTNDLLFRSVLRGWQQGSLGLWISMIVTLLVGAASVLLAIRFTTVLDAILQAYSFMVSGLFIPTLGALFWRRGSSVGALFGMAGGGALTLLLLSGLVTLPPPLAALGLDPTLYGIVFSALLYTGGSLFFPQRERAGCASSILEP